MKLPEKPFRGRGLALGAATCAAVALLSSAPAAEAAPAAPAAASRPAPLRAGTTAASPILPGWYLSPLTYYAGGYAKGAATAHGPYRVSRVTVYTWLYRKRWYGWELRDSDTSVGTNTNSVSSVSRRKCSGRYTYKVSAKATAVYRGRTYYSSNSAQRKYSCR
ncbi:hypothetical protein [Actinomadura macrotermitis]|uniref:Uncharacterized protein n=1 Tax=Actinomadura macrotermitis TaxID=2585200 RepID=A0A7K0BSE1_9ACTN|nr:hypothetical protein [Actinomadura macrotermitis]MQY03956.1 hypothetical protein [Actinomadura macrotermitis]